jgi:hypothetical protein
MKAAIVPQTGGHRFMATSTNPLLPPAKAALSSLLPPSVPWSRLVPRELTTAHQAASLLASE